ncbi:MAG: hypothetical protein IPP37_17340 [Saprospiraceae bacterium]|nr:hypothetical protein [Saprospiraceae bacterium]
MMTGTRDNGIKLQDLFVEKFERFFWNDVVYIIDRGNDHCQLGDSQEERKLICHQIAHKMNIALKRAMVMMAFDHFYLAGCLAKDLFRAYDKY